jgi:hypothetical protein
MDSDAVAQHAEGTTPVDSTSIDQVYMEVGPGSIRAYSRLSYTMWHALAEFIDNSTQSRENYDAIIDDVLKQEGTPLVVTITNNRLQKTLTIDDNSIGMTKDDLIAALQISRPTKDSVGRSKYGMGMKTAACWIGKKWKIVTCELYSGLEWTAEIDVEAVSNKNPVKIESKVVSRDLHYTKIVIEELQRRFKRETEESIRAYLGSMYRFDINDKKLKIIYDGEEIPATEEYNIDTDIDGKPMRIDISGVTIAGKTISGWVAVLRKGGRKFGGFSLFQNKRQIQGYPNAWKPRSIFGGVDDEGANNLVSQRLTGLINLDGFQVSHTKDKILFADDEEDELETFLLDLTKDYRAYATRRRGEISPGWTREKIRDLATNLNDEFNKPELVDAIAEAILPPFEMIVKADQRQIASLTPENEVTTFQVGPEIKIVLSVKDDTENDPYVTIQASSEPGKVHIIVNRIHPYYGSLETADEMNECLRQYVYDAIAEYKVSRKVAAVQPNSVRKLKDSLLRARETAIENAASALANGGGEVDLTP